MHKHNEVVEAELGTPQPEQDVNEQNPTTLTLDHEWDDYVIDLDDGILSPISIDTERAQSSLSGTNSLAEPHSSKKKRKLNDTSPSIKTGKSQKSEVCLNNFMEKCTDIGSNISYLLKENLKTDTSDTLPNEDYHFMWSMVETMRKIKSEKEKLILKSNFLLQVAEVIEKETINDSNHELNKQK